MDGENQKIDNLLFSTFDFAKKKSRSSLDDSTGSDPG